MNTDPELHLLVSKSQIALAIERLAAEIRRDYRDKNPVLVGVLKGSFIFLADLVRLLDIPLEIDFVRLSSYGDGTQSSGNMALVHGLSSDIKDRHVLLIEDILDTGLSIAYLRDYLRSKGPASVKICVLSDKPSRRKTPITIDYLGFIVPDKFIVGYGSDYAEQYRQLPEIFFIDEQG